ISIEKTARRTIAARCADDYLTAGDARSHREAVKILGVGNARLPNRLTGEGIERKKPPVDYRRDDRPVVKRDSTIHDSTAHLGPHGSLIDFRVPAPAFLAGAGVKGIHDAPGGNPVNSVVPD